MNLIKDNRKGYDYTNGIGITINWTGGRDAEWISRRWRRG